MKTVENDFPVIKTFIYKNSYFVYDTFSNRLFDISKDVFIEINHLQKVGLSRYMGLNKNTKAYKDVIILINKGLFKAQFIQKIKHPETEYIQYLLGRCVNDVTLQITRDCNFNCRYCLYANDTKFERNHERINMSWEIAKKSLDFLADHSVDAKSINIAFYGGEPLLNFPLIVKIVEYAENLFYTKKVTYSMTINGSLLTDQIICFLIKYNFDITISLDGPAAIQNYHRKFYDSGKGTFHIVYENVKKIKNNYTNYFYNNVSFIPVLFPDEDYQEVLKFYKSFNVPEEHIIPLDASLNGFDYISSSYSAGMAMSEKVAQKREITLSDIYEDKRSIPLSWHPNGQCIPAVRKLFIDINGIFYPCEKIIEQDALSIGNLYDGFNIQRIVEFMNIGKLTERECLHCWAIRFCNMCVSSCYDIEKKMITKEKRYSNCNYQKEGGLLFFKKYIDDKIIERKGI